jgi:hypothetical protein
MADERPVRRSGAVLMPGWRPWRGQCPRPAQGTMQDRGRLLTILLACRREDVLAGGLGWAHPRSAPRGRSRFQDCNTPPRDGARAARAARPVGRCSKETGHPAPDRSNRRRRGADERDERAALHSITSSARASTVAGMLRPSAFAVLRLITSSYLVGACTGRSAGFSPLRMRST